MAESLLEEESEPGDSSSTTSEELITTPRASRSSRPENVPVPEEESMFMKEIEITEKDIRYLMSHPKKSTVWLSKRMAEKSKEHMWTKLSISEKQKFDLSQAKELSNVLQSRALRALTAQEWKDFSPASAMQMRWVLTTKSDGTAKSRLVVLGYQAHNITSVQSAAPTMARISRNVILMICANAKFRVRAGDVTAAFLQADQNLEGEELYVWAPSELAVLFGADPRCPVMPLKIRKAFYGLVHAPRLWHEHVKKVLLAQGWQQLASDGCVFILLNDKSELVACAGLHVDDFLIGGRDGDPTYEKARKSLEESFKWGKWDGRQFCFCWVSNHSVQRL